MFSRSSTSSSDLGGLAVQEVARRFAFEDFSEVSGRDALRIRMGHDGASRRVSFGELRSQVLAAAAALQHAGCQPGDLVALLLPHTERLPTLFLGAIYGGYIPCILAWPTARMDGEKYQRNLRDVVAGLSADALVTEAEMAARLGAALGRTRVIEPVAGLPSTVRARVRTQGPLFVQFSGGTTGTQKAVPISLEMLQCQLVEYGRTLALNAGDAFISWLPLYHDMGLVACQLMPFVYRLPVTMFDPMQWVMDPGAFLAAVGEDQATLCWLPNFAYAFMAAKVTRGRRALNLCSLRAVVNCSEPVRASSLDSFAERFGPYGLRPEALHSCYAMAEATFAVTQSTAMDPPRRLRVLAAALGRGRIVASDTGDRVLVSSGKPLPGVELRVVDARGARAEPGRIGEIWLRGPVVLQDYLHAPTVGEPSRSAFSPDGWYRTGDLGTLWDGHLYVTGRQKDLIIVGGVNIFAEDVELASQVDGVHAGRAVAMGWYDTELGTERLVVVAEVNERGDLRRAAEIESRIRHAVAALCNVTPYRVLIVPPRWIIKSTAGKTSRAETKARLIARWTELEPDAPFGAIMLAADGGETTAEEGNRERTEL